MIHSIAFELSMPNVGSWNGKWSGAARRYVRLKRIRATKKHQAKAVEMLVKCNHYYDFGDGWGANVELKAVNAIEARKLAKESAGFAGYDWMIEEICEHGRILKLSERRKP